MGKKIVIGLVLILLAMFGYSEAGVHPPTLNTPWTWNTTSSFGPRDVTSGTYFHRGIDFGGTFGTSIRAIENGYVTKISRASEGGYYIKYESDKLYPENGNKSNEWFYFHMFSDTLTTTSTKWEYVAGNTTTGYTFINSKDTSKLYSTSTIIKWSNKSTRQAEQILCIIDYDGYYVKDSNGNYILNSAGSPILAKGRFTGNDYLGPVGSSGTGTTPHPHLHVALNDQNDNPLFYLKHGNHRNEPNTDARFTIPANSIVASAMDNNLNYRLKADINTNITTNYDLDEVRFLIDGELQYDNYSMESKFCFGGRPDYGIPSSVPVFRDSIPKHIRF